MRLFIYPLYRCDIYDPLNRTSSRIVREAAASGLAQEFRIVLPAKVKIKNSSSSVYSRLYGSNLAGNIKWRRSLREVFLSCVPNSLRDAVETLRGCET